jgi:hypothetical protein
MSGSQSSDVHSAVVRTWENKFKPDITLDQRIRLFELGINSIENRASTTLSSVTLLVILDRVLHQSRDKYSVLSCVSIELNSLKLRYKQSHNELASQELLEALRFLLVELLTVLGRITADILTIPLHNELLKVTWNEPETK